MEVYKRFKTDLFIFCIVWIAITFFTGGYRYDSTDGEKRSGMNLRIDAMTGCHYLEGAKGGITPRLTIDGRHICK